MAELFIYWAPIRLSICGVNMHSLARQFKPTGLKKCINLPRSRLQTTVSEHGLVSRSFWQGIWLCPLCSDSLGWQPSVSAWKPNGFTQCPPSSCSFAHVCVRLSTCVCEPDSVMWEEGVSLPYLGKASKPGDEAGVHKVQLITPNASVQSGNPPPHCLLCTAKGP